MEISKAGIGTAPIGSTPEWRVEHLVLGPLSRRKIDENLTIRTAHVGEGRGNVFT